MQKTIIFIVWVTLILFACKEEKQETYPNPKQEAIKDPNDPKPMALMMRGLANNCDSMRIKIKNGEPVDSIQYPIFPFWTAEPTDSSVLETLFFDNAKEFEQAYRKLMQNKDLQKENYTALINVCIKCHTSYCSGPLKRIRKLPLDYIPK